MTRMHKLCSPDFANKLGYMQELNMETVRAIGIVLERIDKLRPE